MSTMEIWQKKIARTKTELRTSKAHVNSNKAKNFVSLSGKINFTVLWKRSNRKTTKTRFFVSLN